MITIKITNSFNTSYLQFKDIPHLRKFIQDDLGCHNFKGDTLEKCMVYLNGFQKAEVIADEEFENVSKDCEEVNWLKQSRIKYNLTQQELSIRTGLSVHTIQNIEQGQRKGSKETLKILNDFFN